MIVVMPFHPGDAEQALRHAEWVLELGGAKGHNLILIKDTRCSTEISTRISDTFEKSFNSVQVLPFTDHYRKWPESPNAVFGMAARFVAQERGEPWAFFEPDSVVLKPRAFDLIAEEYQVAQKAGKHFLGDFVHQNSPGFLDHMSGNAVYPARLVDHAGLTLIANTLAFDVAGASQIIPQMSKSALIVHKWNHPAFTSWEEVQRDIFDLKPDACLFHADKLGSLYPLLSDRLEQKTAIANSLLQLEPQAINPVCDLFLKTFPGDYPWAEYCLRSIDQFCSGFRQLIIIAPDKNCPLPTKTPYQLIVQPESENGYNGQQLAKLNADRYSDASHFIFCDSDTIFTKHVTPGTFFQGGKPIWLMTPFENAREDQKRAWIPVMSKWMGKSPEYEFMRRHSFIFPSWLCEEMRTFCQLQHGMSLQDYVLGAGDGLSFSEFNNAGFLAYENFRDRFHWVNTETDEVPEGYTLQHWSRGGITKAIRTTLERILGPASEIVSSEPNGTAESIIATIDGQIPWQDKTESLSEIGRLSSRLKQFCTGPVRTRQVRDVLRENGVIK